MSKPLGLPRPLLDIAFQTDGAHLSAEYASLLLDVSQHSQEVMRGEFERLPERIER